VHTPPNPDSASATIGASQSTSALPSMVWIWSARRSALLMRLTTVGTDDTAYSDWSGYICSESFASAATCQPER
jgi:hypothetical protein